MRSIRLVAWAAAPRVTHAFGACPIESSHGKKWSLLTAKSKPTSSAPTTCEIRSTGPACSVIIV